ncbi:MAG: hypothetical protein M1828_001159 [Chrysothrix sp. TS-e1954]|nr:MAG: hypothetical protein M1828_001159 [Chrysothrix sp. TS-e1954]
MATGAHSSVWNTENIRRSTRSTKAPKLYDEEFPALRPSSKSTNAMPPKKAAAAKTAEPAKEKAAKVSKASGSTTTKAAASKASTTKKPAAAKAAAPAKKAPAAKKDAATKKAPAKKAAAATATTTTKRKAADAAPAPKRQKKEPAQRAPKAARPARPAPAPKAKVVINHAPTQRLDLLVFGANSGAELGLGPQTNSASVKRPRINPYLSADTAGVVAFACGGMHSVALTHDNRIVTWGVNDHGALGRDTTWAGAPTNDANADDDSSSSSSSEGGALNPLECTPTAIDASAFPEDTVFTAVAATDSATFVLTDDGHVYGWGIFRSIDGPLGFSPGTRVAHTPTYIPTLTRITKLATGSNHVLALSQTGTVYAWGSGEMNQLGRRIIERNRTHGLEPRAFGLTRHYNDIGAGSEHSFAVHSDGRVLGWGLNNFGQTGVDSQIGEDNATVVKPTAITSLAGRTISNVTGGNHHSIALDTDGQLLVWGRCENHALGLDLSALPTDEALVLRSGAGNRPVLVKQARTISTPTFAHAATSSDHVVAAGTDGKAYSWGFSASYQTGQGTDDDVEMVSVIDNTAVRGRTIVASDCGGQFSVIGAVAAGQ